MAAMCDVNFLLAFAAEGHMHHKAARHWFEKNPGVTVNVCRVAQLGFLRLLNNPAVMKDAVMDSMACWEIWEQLVDSGYFCFAEVEPQGLETALKKFTSQKAYTPRLWTDAYLAAFACAGKYTMLTFDRGFAKFDNLVYEIPS